MDVDFYVQIVYLVDWVGVLVVFDISGFVFVVGIVVGFVLVKLNVEEFEEFVGCWLEIVGDVVKVCWEVFDVGAG